MKNIQVSKEVWQILRKIKNDYQFKHFNQVIKWLLVTFYSDKNTVELPTRESGQIEKQLFIDKNTANIPRRYKRYNSDHTKVETRYPRNKFSIDKNTINNIPSNQTTQIQCKNCNRIITINWDGKKHGQILCPYCKQIIFW
jgi:formylmethanofuran dehydrogenase subunit E